MQLIKWIFNGFVLALVMINGALTLSFGFTYLGRAFGTGMLADYAGAAYALLIFDIAYLTWFWVFTRTAESNGQRQVAGLMAVVALIGSIMATLNQLAVNSFGLVDLSAYHEVVGFIALGSMLVITALHIISTAGYFLLSPSERTRQKTININAEALELTLNQVEADMRSKLGELADIMTREGVADVMFKMGFTPEGDRLTGGQAKQKALPKPKERQNPINYRHLSAPPQMGKSEHFYLEELVNGRWVPTDITGTSDGTYDHMIEMKRGIWRQMQDDGNPIGHVFYADQAAASENEVREADRHSWMAHQQNSGVYAASTNPAPARLEDDRAANFR